jgi:hypothetical protein
MVDPSPREALVILDPSAGHGAHEEISRRARVLQSAGTRLLVLDATTTDLERIRAIPEVARVLSAPAALENLPALDAGETLFLQAWQARQRQTKPTRREGEGLDWDASGFEAP